MPKEVKKGSEKASKGSKTVGESKPEEKNAKKAGITAPGDFILIDLIGRVKDTNQIFDCSKEDIARKENVYDENEVYGAQLVVIGEGHHIKGLETKLIGLEVGKEYTFEIAPEEAFGQRDAAKIKIENIRDFRNQNVKPQIGQRIRIGQRTGTVTRVGGGRVVVDYNPPLAGRTITYQVWVNELITQDDQKLHELIKRRTGPTLVDQFKVEHRDDSIEITIPQTAFYAQQLQLVKAGIALDVFKYFALVKTIQFIETHQRQETVPASAGTDKPQESPKEKEAEETPKPKTRKPPAKPKA